MLDVAMSKEYNTVVREEPAHFYFGNNVSVHITDDKIESVGSLCVGLMPLLTRLNCPRCPGRWLAQH